MGYLARVRYNLWCFLAKMKRGDIVIVPKLETFSVYAICNDVPIMITNKNIDLLIFKENKPISFKGRYFK